MKQAFTQAVARPMRTTCACAALLASGSAASAQTLYERTQAPQAVNVENVRDREPVVRLGNDTPPQLSELSLFYIEPMAEREFLADDIVYIIISERTESTHEQTLETGKTSEFGGSIDSIPVLLNLLELRLDQSDTDIDLAAALESAFTGEGTFERTDEVTGRVAARIVEVKPNGTLLLEAQSTVVNNNETHTITISGYCRSEDISVNNVIQSNQMYNLTLDMQNTGDVDSAAKKGLFTRVFDAIFNF